MNDTTPLEALTRSGHKFPESILEDLEKQGFCVLSQEELELLQAERSEYDNLLAKNKLLAY